MNKALSRMLPEGLPPIHWHSLRHSAAVALLSEGVSVLNVADALGHTSPQMLMKVYGHVIPGDRTASQAMDRVLA